MVREVSGAASEEKKAPVRARETAPSIEKLSRLGSPVMAGDTLPSTRTPRILPARSTTATMALSLDVAAAARCSNKSTLPGDVELCVDPGVNVPPVRTGAARVSWLANRAGAERSSNCSRAGRNRLSPCRGKPMCYSLFLVAARCQRAECSRHQSGTLQRCRHVSIAHFESHVQSLGP